MKTRFLLTATVVGLVSTHAAAAPPAAADDPWTKVPALPTACYAGQDGWLDKNGAAFEAVQESLYAQKEENTKVQEAANKAFSENPMAMAQAMQQAMMDDPENAQKMIEKMTQTGTEAQTELPAKQAKEQQLDAESKALLKQYDAALVKATAPAVARWNALQKKMGWGIEPGFPIGPDPSWPQSAWQEWAAIQKDRDAAYVANCAHWWSATGQFQGYMKRYKAYLVQERIPYSKKLVDEAALNQFKMLNVPAGGYRTTSDIEAAMDYMKMASSLYGQRMADPFCQVMNACE